MNVILIPRLAAREVIRKYRWWRGRARELSALMNEPVLSDSYFPEKVRKPKWNIWLENALWLVRHGEVNRNYFLYGMDVKGSKRRHEVLPIIKFNKIRDYRNFNPENLDYNYVGVLRDKFIFSQLLNSLKIPTPTNIALLNREGVTWLSDMSRTPLDYLIKNSNLNINGFCKKLVGINGVGAFLLKIQFGKILINGCEVNLVELESWLDGQYLLQDLIIQHPRLSELHPASVNTMRIITFNNKGKIEVFCTALRIGTRGRCVDNWASGSIMMAIDRETGKLKGEGLYRSGFGGRVNVHPDTGIQLEGFEVPFFKESLDLACKLHSYLYGIYSVGWDLAITPEGPMIIEGNDNWGGHIPMAIEKDFKNRFLKYYQ